MEGHWKFLGAGGLTAKILEAKYEAYGGGGSAKQKTFPQREYGYVLVLHNEEVYLQSESSACL